MSKTGQVSQIKQNFVNQAKEFRLFSKSSREPLISQYRLIRFVFQKKNSCHNRKLRGGKM